MWRFNSSLARLPCLNKDVPCATRRTSKTDAAGGGGSVTRAGNTSVMHVLCAAQPSCHAAMPLFCRSSLLRLTHIFRMVPHSHSH